MGSSYSFTLLLILVASLLHSTTPSYFSFSFIRYTSTSLVFRGCADRKFPNPAGPYTRNLRSLLSSLVSKAYQKPYSNATSGDGNNTLLGLYQCRGDLDNARCGDCVRRIPPLAVRLCGIAIAARIQLGGCYSRYAVLGFRQDGDTEVLYEVCGKEKAGGGFGDKRDRALGMVENGVIDGEGFYAGAYENVYVLGQCEGDIIDGSGDCGSCLGSAVERAKSACGDSISGQVYYSKCYISYRYYPDGVPLSTSTGDVDVKTYSDCGAHNKADGLITEGGSYFTQRSCPRKSVYIKVNMDRFPIGRKIDLNAPQMLSEFSKCIRFYVLSISARSQIHTGNKAFKVAGWFLWMCSRL